MNIKIGPIKSKPGYCIPAWEKKEFEGIKGHRYVCEECERGPCMLGPSDQRAFDKRDPKNGTPPKSVEEKDPS